MDKNGTGLHQKQKPNLEKAVEFKLSRIKIALCFFAGIKVIVQTPASPTPIPTQAPTPTPTQTPTPVPTTDLDDEIPVTGETGDSAQGSIFAGLST